MTASANSGASQRAIIHVDMDAFYASVEQHDQPQYRNLPVVVGGTGGRGVVAAASYEVRKFGVYSAMPMTRALRLCPQAVVLPVRMSRYREISAQVFKVFHEVTPQVEALSLDEAFLDVSASLSLLGSIETIGANLRAEILARTGLHASVGMAQNKFLAKLASDIGKPKGFVHVAQAGVQAFLDPMPIKRIWGLGKQTLPKMQKLGILTIGQLRKSDPAMLSQVLGKRSRHFQALARGEDEREVITGRPEKSISREETFAVDISQPEALLAELQYQAEAVTGRLRAQALHARTILIKVRDNRFRTATRRVTLAAPTASTEVVFKQARGLLQTWLQEHLNTPVRLLGVGLAGLETRHEQRAEFDTAQQQVLDQTLDAINRRYGAGKATRALAMKRGKK